MTVLGKNDVVGWQDYSARGDLGGFGLCGGRKQGFNTEDTKNHEGSRRDAASRTGLFAGVTAWRYVSDPWRNNASRQEGFSLPRESSWFSVSSVLNAALLQNTGTLDGALTTIGIHSHRGTAC
ncbi:MAG: hypothetical protein ABSC06_03475 [Rhodopila sp.]|jgi:hypothetical protein